MPLKFRNIYNAYNRSKYFLLEEEKEMKNKTFAEVMALVVAFILSGMPCIICDMALADTYKSVSYYAWNNMICKIMAETNLLLIGFRLSMFAILGFGSTAVIEYYDD